MKSLVATSQDILEKSTNQLNKVKEYEIPLSKSRQRVEMQKKSVAELKNSLNSTGNKDNEINIKLRELHLESKKCGYILFIYLILLYSLIKFSIN